jgi:hypothetical protein
MYFRRNYGENKMTLQEAWEVIKKALTPNSNGELDTIEWVYRPHSKIIDEALKENKNETNKV